MINYLYRKTKLVMAKKDVYESFYGFGYNPFYVDDVNFTDRFEDTDFSYAWFEFIYSCVEQLHKNRDVVQEYDSFELATSSVEVANFIRNKITNLELLIDGDQTSFLIWKIVFQYKYATVRTFFQDNYKKFVPEFDLETIESGEKRKLLLKAFMFEFDKLAEMIEYASANYDIEQVREDFMYYLGEMVGNFRDEYLTDDGFREFSKYIIEIYKRKGSRYSFELYFNLLGFSIEITEYWFDKRFNNPSYIEEQDRRFVNKRDFTYYLTPTRPTEFIPNGLSAADYVLEEQFVEPKNLLYFNKLRNDNAITVDSIFDTVENQGYGFTYFKTNFVTYEVVKEKDSLYTSEDISSGQIIRRYIEFLTPIFIKYDLIFANRPFEELFELNLLDNKRYYSVLQDIGRGLYSDASTHGDLIKDLSDSIGIGKSITKNEEEEFIALFQEEFDNPIYIKSFEDILVKMNDIVSKVFKTGFEESSVFGLSDSYLNNYVQGATESMVQNFIDDANMPIYKKNLIDHITFGMDSVTASSYIKLIDDTVKGFMDEFVSSITGNTVLEDKFTYAPTSFEDLDLFEEWITDLDGFTQYNGIDEENIIYETIRFKADPIKTPPHTYS